MLFEKVENKRIITFYFKTSTVDIGECIQPQQHWPKQHSKAATPHERLLSIIQFFAKVFRRRPRPSLETPSLVASSSFVSISWL